MTSRDLAFWLQGCIELGGIATLDAAGASGADIIRKHAQLVRVTEPTSGFAIAVEAIADQPVALCSLVAAQFVHVIDATMPPVEKDPAHKPAPSRPDNGPTLYRC